MPPGALLVLVVLPQNLLYLREGIFVYQWLVTPLGRDITRLHPGLAEIEAVMEHLTPGLFANAIAFPASSSHGICMVGPFLKGPFAAGELFECLGNKLSVIRVNLDPGGRAVMLIEIAPGSLLRPPSSLHFSLQTLADLNSQVF
ncbi:MAG: hypothetical protein PHY28_09205 [Dehalococcoidales bacterium]|nr:hypothetical protein [Dehalococcoidales bacterium]